MEDSCQVFRWLAHRQIGTPHLASEQRISYEYRPVMLCTLTPAAHYETDVLR